MNSLLDTCTFSEYRNKKPNPKVVAWLDAQIEDSLFLSVVTVGELHKGIEKMPASKRKTNLQAWLRTTILRFDKRILPVGLKTIQIWGGLLAELETKGRVLPVLDSLIAATALEHDLTVITRNEADFADTGAKVLNIWK
jgi:toxin FitB